MGLKTSSSDRQQRLIVSLAVAALLFLYVVAGITAYDDYRGTIGNAEQQLSTLNILLAEETTRTVDGVRIAVEGVASELASRGLQSDRVLRMSVSADPLLKSSLTRTVAVLPQLSGIEVVASDGTLILSSGDMSNSEASVAGNQAFENLRSGPATVVSAPETDPRTGEIAIMVAHRIDGPDGAFRGAVLGFMPVVVFENLYRSLGIGEGGAVSLWKQDGRLLARYPQYSSTGDHIRQIFAEGSPHGITLYQTVSVNPELPGHRLIAVSAVREYPLAVSTSFSMDVVLAQWWQQVLYSLAWCLLLLIFAVLVVYGMRRQFENVETIKRVAQERERALDDRSRIAEQLRQSQKLEVVGQLTAGIAHDFNNLLTVIIGHLEIVGRRLGPEDSPPRRSVDAAMSGARKAAVLTHRLLAFARKQPLAPSSLDVGSLVTGIADLLKRTLGESVEVVIAVDEDVWPVYADASQLENALVNLAVNSRDAMPNGGKVEVSVRNVSVDSRLSNIAPGLSGDFVAISVSDTGTGMTSDVLAKAFEPFFSTKEIGKGSGLGLSQIYGFARQSGGDCSIESQEGEGTTVTVYLPRSSLPAALVEDESSIKATRGTGEMVLVIEDNPELRDYAVRALRELGYSVRQADNGPEAIAILGKVDIDIVLSDVGLPGMEGPEVVEECLRLQPSMGVVFMTGYTDKIDAIQRRFGEGAGILHKPFSFVEISVVVSEALKRTKIAA